MRYLRWLTSLLSRSLRRSHTGRHCTCKVTRCAAAPHPWYPMSPCLQYRYLYGAHSIDPAVPGTLCILPTLFVVPPVVFRSQLTVFCVPAGFLHGLCGALLPDTYTELGCGIRPHVLCTQKVLDPFSPFLLELPRIIPPMWSTSSPDGERDVVHGNLITAGQRTSLLQCSR